MIEVTDHFLDRESYRKIADFLLSSDKCDWKYNHEKVSSSKDELNNYQFIFLIAGPGVRCNKLCHGWRQIKL